MTAYKIDQHIDSIMRAIDGGVVISKMLRAVMSGESLTLTAKECDDALFLVRNAREHWKSGRT